jgi:hypothetical protein
MKKLFGEKDIEPILHRLDRLTNDEARTTAAETLRVVYSLVQEMSKQTYSTRCRFVVEHLFLIDGKASVESVWEALGVFCWQLHDGFVSDRALEILHQLATDMNKSKRQSFPPIATTDGKH